jgi:hypothetical protein
MTGLALVAIALLGVLTLLNLILTYGVIRRLREHEERLGKDSATPALPEQPAIGTPLPAFTAMTTAGQQITDRDFAAGTVYVGIFSTQCRPCHEQLPRFLERVSTLDPYRVLLVINDDGDDPVTLADLVARAATVGRVVMAPTPAPLATALGVERFPTMLMLDDGVVVANSHDTGRLPVPAGSPTGR